MCEEFVDTRREEIVHRLLSGILSVLWNSMVVWVRQPLEWMGFLGILLYLRADNSASEAGSMYKYSLRATNVSPVLGNQLGRSQQGWKFDWPP